MTRYKLALSCVVALTMTAFGFMCSSSSTTTFTLKRYSSIPPIVRWTVFSSDCRVTILDPPKTDDPFTFTMSQSTCDSLERLCAEYASFDSEYVPTGHPIPNSGSMDFEFKRNGVVKNVHMIGFPTIPPKLDAIFSFAARIEDLGMRLRQTSGH